uniref:LRP chaperone MESD n=1 Tax=Bos taurus TaxID=9913 RepID=A0AAF6YIC6_BOVIN
MAASGWARAAVIFLCACDLLLLLLLPPRAFATEGPAETPGEATPPPRKKKKDIRDYNDADMARLLEQWEADSLPSEPPGKPKNTGVGSLSLFQQIFPIQELNQGLLHDEETGLEVYEVWSKAMQKDDDIEEGDLPEHKRPSAPIDFSQIDPGKPESILKMTKKGKTLMMFVTVSGNPTEKETEEITSLWQGSLFNANYDVQRFIVGSDRAIFMLRDGGYAWEIKDFLVSQDRCADVTLEGQVYPGKGGGSKEKNQTKQEKGKKKKERDLKPRASKEDNRAGSKKEEL